MSDYGDNTVKFAKRNMTVHSDFKNMVNFLFKRGFKAPTLKNSSYSFGLSPSYILPEQNHQENNFSLPLTEVVTSLADKSFDSLQFPLYLNDFRIYCSIFDVYSGVAKAITIELFRGAIDYDGYYCTMGTKLVPNSVACPLNLHRSFMVYQMVKDLHYEIGFEETVVVNSSCDLAYEPHEFPDDSTAVMRLGKQNKLIPFYEDYMSKYENFTDLELLKIMHYYNNEPF